MSEKRSLFRTGPLDSNRVEAFSDGVLAVVITLLVLEVKLPTGLSSEAELWHAIERLLPGLAAWVVSFVFVLTFWVSHHYFFSNLKHVDRGLLWLNGLFLLTVALIPFPTALVGQYPGMTPPLVLLSAVMLLTSLSFACMRFYASFCGQLLKDHLSKAQAKAAMIQSMIAPFLYAIAMAVAFAWPPGSILIQVGVLLLFFLRSPSNHPREARRVKESPR